MSEDIPPLPPGVPRVPRPAAPVPPGLPQAPLVTTEGLKVGDVVQIAVQLQDKMTGEAFWWKRFAVITRLPRAHLRHRMHYFMALTLKMHPDLETDLREINLVTDEKSRPQVVTKLEEPYPQGVSACLMKALAMGWVVPGE